MNKYLLLLCSVLLMVQACTKDETPDPVVTDPVAKEKIVVIKSDFGNMYLWLYKETPLHRENFLKLVEEGFYNGTTFHRIIEDFMIQGGDPNSKDNNPGNDGMGGPGYTLPAEFVDTLKNIRGAVAAARTPDNVNPNKASSGSQFYINLVHNVHLDGNYTVFGLIMKGMDVADRIVEQPSDGNNRPLTDITMELTVLEQSREEILKNYGFSIP